MNKEQLSVIIVDYNSITKTLNYITNLHALLEQDFDIHYVVVENYEKAINTVFLDRFKHGWHVQEKKTKDYQQIYTIFYHNSRIDILWSGTNNGFAAGNNIGSVYTRTLFHPSWILYSNNDIILNSDFNMKNMIRILQEDDSVAVVGPCVVGINGHRQGPAQKTGYVWGLLFHDFIPDRFRKETELIANPQKGYVYWVSGCFMLASADKMYIIGLFDEQTFLYCEEMILAERFLSHGWHFYYDNRTQIIHEGGATISQYADDLKQLQIKFASRLYYYKTYLKINRLQQLLAILVFRGGLILHRWKNSVRKRNQENENK